MKLNRGTYNTHTFVDVGVTAVGVGIAAVGLVVSAPAWIIGGAIIGVGYGINNYIDEVTNNWGREVINEWKDDDSGHTF